MLQFQHPAYLLLLLLLPLAALLFAGFLRWRKKRMARMGDRRLVIAQMQGFNPRRATLRFSMLSLAFLFTTLALANLRQPGSTAKTQTKGVDVMIALDVSKSMLATDVSPSRLVRARQLIERLLAQLGNNRVGLILFAGRAYQQVPLTTDFASLRMMLQNSSPQQVPAQGTVISDAIAVALEGFPKNEKKYRALLVISDGEDHEDKAVTAARDVAEGGLVIHTIGVGSPEGTTIPDPESRGVKLDDKGQPVVSRLNEKMLQEIAAAGQGTYTHLVNRTRWPPGWPARFREWNNGRWALWHTPIIKITSSYFFFRRCFAW